MDHFFLSVAISKDLSCTTIAMAYAHIEFFSQIGLLPKYLYALFLIFFYLKPISHAEWLLREEDGYYYWNTRGLLNLSP